MRPHTQTEASIKQKQNVTHKQKPENVTHLIIVKKNNHLSVHINFQQKKHKSAELKFALYILQCCTLKNRSQADKIFTCDK